MNECAFVIVCGLANIPLQLHFGSQRKDLEMETKGFFDIHEIMTLLAQVAVVS